MSQATEIQHRARCRASRMSSSSAPGSAACTCCIALRGLGLSGDRVRCRQRCRRHLVLEPLPGRTLRRGEHAVFILVLRGVAAGMAVERDRSPASRKSCDMPTTSLTGLDLRRDMRFETRVTGAVFDEATHRWTVRTDRGDVVSARYCVMATGCLSAARLPDFPGLDSFKGKTYHTGHWPHEGVDFTGLRVGVVGTGSSAIQAIPVIAAQAAHVTVFQRTPNFSIPSRNGPMPDAYAQSWKEQLPRESGPRLGCPRNGILANPNDQSAIETPEPDRLAVYEQRWASGGTTFMAAFNDLIFNKASNDTAAEFVRDKIRAMVKDPAKAELLAPTNHPIGTKRICVDTDYYLTYNRPNVDLVDVRDAPIEAMTPDGLRVGGQRVCV